MARTAVGLLVVGLALVLIAARGNAQNGSGLGCAVGGNDAPPRYATCETNEDCAPVGGIACSGGGICFCDGGDLSPFCACLATGDVTGAPVVGGGGLIVLIGLLCAVGVAALSRRKGYQPSAS